MLHFKRNLCFSLFLGSQIAENTTVALIVQVIHCAALQELQWTGCGHNLLARLMATGP